MAPHFSIILPTLRPKLCACALYSIQVGSAGHDYEVLVVSPFEVKGDRVRWVHEREARGNVAAHARGFEASRGDIIVTMTDDTLVLPGWLDTIEQRIVDGERQSFPYCLSLHRINDPYIGTVFGFYFAYYPIASRRSAEAVGGIFDPVYRANFADPDFGLRIWTGGGRVEFCAEATGAMSSLQRHFTEAAHKTSERSADFAQLLRRWGHLAGDEFSTHRFDVTRSFPQRALQGNTFKATQVKAATSWGEIAAREYRRRRILARKQLSKAKTGVLRKVWGPDFFDSWTPEQMYRYEVDKALQRYNALQRSLDPVSPTTELPVSGSLANASGDGLARRA